MANIYIIAGPNGAGKTTVSLDFLKENLHVSEYVNVDDIARELNPTNPERANLRAGRIALQKMQTLSSKNVDFVFETTLSGKFHEPFLKKCISKGYVITLTYLWLPSAEMAVKRVENRAKQGGHWIPEKDIKRRFSRGLENLMKIYLPLCHRGIIVDSSKPVGKQPKIAEKKRNGEILTIYNEEIWKSLLKEANHGR